MNIQRGARVGCLSLALALLCSTSGAQSPQVEDVVFVDELHGWVLTLEPTPAIFRTNDGGNHWLRVPIEFEGGFCRFDFLDKDTGIAIGIEPGRVAAIYRTEDAGQTWIRVSQIEFQNHELLVNVVMISRQEAFVVGAGEFGRGYVGQLSDGGRRVQKRDDLPADFSRQSNALGVLHDGNGHVWIVGKEMILHSGDYGKTWENQYRNSVPRIDMAMAGTALPGGYAWLAVANFAIYKTEDFGNRWTKVLDTWEQGAVNFDSISLVSPTRGCAVGNSALLFCTEDGGATWSRRRAFKSFQQSGRFRSRLQLFRSGRGWASVNGALFKTEDGGASFREVLTKTDVLETGADAPAKEVSINGPTELALDGNHFLYIVESVEERLLRLDLKKKTLRVVLTREGGNMKFDYPNAVAVDKGRDVVVADFNGRLKRVDATTGLVTVMYSPAGTRTELERVDAMALEPSGDILLLADDMNHRVMRWRSALGRLETVTSEGLRFPMGVAVMHEGDVVIADYENCRIRRIENKTGAVTTIAGTGVCASKGDGGRAVEAALNYPSSIVADNRGNLFFVEGATDRVRKIDAHGFISTYAGTGEKGFSGDGGAANKAKLNNPSGLAVDSRGNLYISEYVNNRVRRVDAGTGRISTVAGNGNPQRVEITL